MSVSVGGGQCPAEIVRDTFVEATRHGGGAEADGCGGSGEPPSEDGGPSDLALTNQSRQPLVPSLARAIVREVEG